MVISKNEMLSVIIPARNEIYLEKTVRNILENARGEIEILVILDGWVPDPQIEFNDKRVIFFHFEESIGQRQGINYAANKAKGKYVMKLDAHCAVDEGFDVKLAADCPYEWTVIPRMYNLDIKTWKPKLHKRTDYMYMGFNDKNELRALYYTGREYWRQHRKKAEIDETMCCMGPCFYMHKDRFWELGGCDENHGGWGQQGIEVACKAWLSGGALMVNKKTWFSHWFRGGGGPGFPYSISGRTVKAARNYSKDLWLNDKWVMQKRKFQWLIDKFNPPGWANAMSGESKEGNEKKWIEAQRAVRRVFGVKVREDFSPIGANVNRSRNDLPEVWNRLNYKVGVEIGVHRAEFTAIILEKMPDVKLYGIDPWDVYPTSKYTEEGQVGNKARALQRLEPFIREGRCEIKEQYSLDAVKDFEDESLDFVFIDGCHDFENAVMDIIHWSKKVRQGGIVAIHDYCPQRRGGVIEAVDGYTKCNRIEPWFVIREDLPTAFWVKKYV